MEAPQPSRDLQIVHRLESFACLVKQCWVTFALSERLLHVKGIWLGKALANDTHILAHSNGVFVTRSVRRLPTPFVLEPLGEMELSPWEFGYAALGHRMTCSKTVSPPQPFGMPMIDVEAVQVRKYADEHPHEDMEPPAEDLPSGDATTFRTFVGILMYLANDLPHCQYVIRYLSTYSSKPTHRARWC